MKRAMHLIIILALIFSMHACADQTDFLFAFNREIMQKLVSESDAIDFFQYYDYHRIGKITLTNTFDISNHLRKNDLSLNYTCDLDNDGVEEFVIMGVNNNTNISWRCFLLIVSLKNGKYIREAFFPSENIFLMRIEDCSPYFSEYCEGKFIGIGYWSGDPGPIIVWNSDKKQYQTILIDSEE